MITNNLSLSTFNDVIDTNDKGYWLIARLHEARLVLTEDGLYQIGCYPGVKFEGSFCFVGDKVYRPSKYRIIGNWFDWIVYSKYPKLNNHFPTAIKENFIDYGDFETLSDGIIGVVNKNGDQTSEWIPFNQYVINLIKQAQEQ